MRSSVDRCVDRRRRPGAISGSCRTSSAPAVCARRRGSEPHKVESGETTWLLDPGGRQLASLPGCTLDLASDGQSALLPGSGDRGVRLWQRSGGYRDVLGADAVAAAARTVEFDADPGGYVVGNAWLSPDGRQALVGIYRKTRRDLQNVFWGQGAALLRVDLPSRRWQVIPVELPGAYPVVWGPAGGFAYAQTFDTGTLTTWWFRPAGRPSVSYVPAKGRPVLLEAGRRHDHLRIGFSPDGDWLLIPDEGNWTFVRVDDPSTRVAYSAPGNFAGWLPGSAAR